MSYGRESWAEASGRRFDVKQIVCTIIAAVFGVGLIFLVGIHIGKQVGVDDVGAEASAALGPLSGGSDSTAATEVDAAHEAAALAGVSVEADTNDYRFFELLDAPAPTRELPEVELAMNPVLEERRNKKKNKKTDEADANDQKKEAKVADKKPAANKASEKAADKKVARAEPTADEKPVHNKKVEDKPAKPAAAERKVAAEPVSNEPDLNKLMTASLVASKATTEKKPAAADKAETKVDKADKTEKKADKKKRGRFTVQVSAFQDEAAAESLAADFRRKGHKAHVKAETIAGRGTWYRVRVGQFADREAASEARATIKGSDGYDGFVTSM